MERHLVSLVSAEAWPLLRATLRLAQEPGEGPVRLTLLHTQTKRAGEPGDFTEHAERLAPVLIRIIQRTGRKGSIDLQSIGPDSSDLVALDEALQGCLEAGSIIAATNGTKAQFLAMADRAATTGSRLWLEDLATHQIQELRFAKSQWISEGGPQSAPLNDLHAMDVVEAYSDWEPIAKLDGSTKRDLDGALVATQHGEGVDAALLAMQAKLQQDSYGPEGVCRATPYGGLLKEQAPFVLLRNGRVVVVHVDATGEKSGTAGNRPGQVMAWSARARELGGSTARAVLVRPNFIPGPGTHRAKVLGEMLRNPVHIVPRASWGKATSPSYYRDALDSAINLRRLEKTPPATANGSDFQPDSDLSQALFAPVGREAWPLLELLHRFGTSGPKAGAQAFLYRTKDLEHSRIPSRRIQQLALPSEGERSELPWLESLRPVLCLPDQSGSDPTGPLQQWRGLPKVPRWVLGATSATKMQTLGLLNIRCEIESTEGECALWLNVSGELMEYRFTDQGPSLVAVGQRDWWRSLPARAAIRAHIELPDGTELTQTKSIPGSVPTKALDVVRKAVVERGSKGAGAGFKLEEMVVGLTNDCLVTAALQGTHGRLVLQSLEVRQSLDLLDDESANPAKKYGTIIEDDCFVMTPRGPLLIDCVLSKSHGSPAKGTPLEQARRASAVASQVGGTFAGAVLLRPLWTRSSGIVAETETVARSFSPPVTILTEEDLPDLAIKLAQRMGLSGFSSSLDEALSLDAKHPRRLAVGRIIALQQGFKNSLQRRKQLDQKRAKKAAQQATQAKIGSPLAKPTGQPKEIHASILREIASTLGDGEIQADSLHECIVDACEAEGLEFSLKAYPPHGIKFSKFLDLYCKDIFHRSGATVTAASTS